MMKKKQGNKTVSELMSELSHDPAFAEKARKSRKQFDVNLAQYLREEVHLRNDLELVGERVETVWDLVNRADDYPTAIPILRLHLLMPHTPRVLEGIVRSLTLPRLRAVINDELWQVFFARDGRLYEQARGAILAAFSIVGMPSDRARLETLAANPTVSEDERTAARYALRNLPA